MAHVDYSRFDTSELRHVAEVLQHTNPARAGDVESTMAYIANTGNAEYSKSGNFGYLETLGFCITPYNYCGNVNDVRFKVTLSSYGIRLHVADVRVKKAAERDAFVGLARMWGMPEKDAGQLWDANNE
jgi:hypothetical protein